MITFCESWEDYKEIKGFIEVPGPLDFSRLTEFEKEKVLNGQSNYVVHKLRYCASLGVVAIGINAGAIIGCFLGGGLYIKSGLFGLFNYMGWTSMATAIVFPSMFIGAVAGVFVAGGILYLINGKF